VKIAEALQESCVITDVRGRTKREVISELVHSLQEAGLIGDAGEAAGVIEEREKLGSTGIGDGVAIPHGKMKGLQRIFCVFGRSAEGVDFDSVDGKPVHIFFLLLAPEDSAGLHLKMLSRISKILRDPSFRKKLTEFTDTSEVYRNIVNEDARH
jgi:PTS system nitrogen regulatory IIA component